MCRLFLYLRHHAGQHPSELKPCEQAKQLANLYRCLHPDCNELRRKKLPPRSNVKAARPIRIKVILDATKLDETVADDPMAVLKIL
jgi:hypothetical protein